MTETFGRVEDSAGSMKYEGELRNGLPHGYGIGVFQDGTEVMGEWEDGLPNGYVISLPPDGGKYVGMVKDGDPEGFGAMFFAKDHHGGRRLLIAEWSQGTPRGKGSNQEVIGPSRKEIGEMKNGQLDGKGIVLALGPGGKTGGFRVGEWRAGKPIEDGFSGNTPL
jgi:hypothetical protein